MVSFGHSSKWKGAFSFMSVLPCHNLVWNWCSCQNSGAFVYWIIPDKIELLLGSFCIIAYLCHKIFRNELIMATFSDIDTLQIIHHYYSCGCTMHACFNDKTTLMDIVWLPVKWTIYILKYYFLNFNFKELPLFLSSKNLKTFSLSTCELCIGGTYENTQILHICQTAAVTPDVWG